MFKIQATTYPLFVAAYHLWSGSPCKDAGDNNAQELPDTDKDGNLRIIDDVVDMGAYEYVYQNPGDELVVDFDGDATTDIAIYRSGSGAWYIIPSSGPSNYAVGWGGDLNDMPVNPTAVIFMKYM